MLKSSIARNLTIKTLPFLQKLLKVFVFKTLTKGIELGLGGILGAFFLSPILVHYSICTRPQPPDIDIIFFTVFAFLF